MPGCDDTDAAFCSHSKRDVTPPFEQGVGRPVDERADGCAQGCNGCDDCTDYDDEPDDQCLHCRGDGMDPDCDYLLPCPRHCTICGAPHNGSGVGTGNGLAHRWCYEKEHPPTPAQNLYQMARGRGDPVLAAEVIAQWVPHELASQIVDDFNIRLMKQWLRRCEP
jgi:hypothetical protein